MAVQLLTFGRGIERVAEFLAAADMSALRLLSNDAAASPLYSLGKRALLSRVAEKKPQKRLVALRSCIQAIGREAQDALLAAFENDRTQLVRAGAARLLARLAKALPVDDRATLFRRVDARYGKELRMFTCRTAIEESFVDVFSEDVLWHDFPGLILSSVLLQSLRRKREDQERKARYTEELNTLGYMRWFDRHAREMMSRGLCPASHQVFEGRCTKGHWALHDEGFRGAPPKPPGVDEGAGVGIAPGTGVGSVDGIGVGKADTDGSEVGALDGAGEGKPVGTGVG